MQHKLQSLITSQGVRQTVLTFAGSLIASGLAAIATILITRQLGPTRFGEFSVGFALLLILVRLCDLGTTNVVQRYGAEEHDPAKISRIFSFTIKIKLVAIFITWSLGVLLSGWLAEVLHVTQPVLIYLAFFLSGATVLYEQVQAMLQSLQRFSQSALINVSQALVKTAAAGMLVFSQATNSIGIFFIYMAAPVLPLIFFRQLFPDWVSIRLRDNFSQERSLIANLAKHSAVAFIAAGIIENIDILFVQHYLNSYETGLLGGVTRIALLFSILAYSLGSVLNPRVARYKEKKDLSAFMKKAWLLAGATLLSFLLFLPFSKWILLLTIGSEYLPALPILNLVVAASFLTIAVIPFVAVFFSLDLPWYFSLSGLVQLAIILTGNLVFVPVYGLEAAAWTRLLARVILFVITVALAHFVYHRQFASDHEKTHT